MSTLTEHQQNFSHHATMYLRNKITISNLQAEVGRMDKYRSWIISTKNNSPESLLRHGREIGILNQRIGWVNRNIKNNRDNMGRCLPKIVAAHKELLSTLRDNGSLFADGQQIFKLSCGSYTRHIKGGSGYALIYGDLLPMMRYS